MVSLLVNGKSWDISFGSTTKYPKKVSVRQREREREREVPVFLLTVPVV